MKKYCTLCKKNLPLEEFNKKSKSKDGLQNVCRECGHKKSKQYYKENREKHIGVCIKNRKKYCEGIRGFNNNFKRKIGCKICGESEPCCLDYHHIEIKENLVSRLVAGASWKKIVSEIAKCTLVCANCHRKIHAGILESPTETLRETVIKMYGEIDLSRVKVVKKIKVINCEICGKIFESYGKKYCSLCRNTKQRKVKRPTKKELQKEIKIGNWTRMGKKYGVSDNAVRKWAKSYGLSW